ncbi:MAG TPA: biopolymer transporter ExbD [Verrucomicrobiae bacterium]|nr:biopolymer transporter ExbD [Verrucomicrobiae bacterium]
MAGGGGGGESGEFGLQIAPMLDVMFVLLLFYMVMAGSQTKEAELSVDLPSEGSAPSGVAPTPVYLKIGRNKQVYFNDSPVDTPASESLPALEARLKAAVRQLGAKNPYIVVPDELSPHQRIVDVLNACVDAGVQNLSFGSS